MIFGAEPSLSWTELFGAARPVEIEVGCGKGSFLLAHAHAHPERSFLGLEVQERWVRHVADRLARAPLGNLRVLRADASLVLTHFVPGASVAAVHLYFPDPWWKRRHAHRRLLTPAFAETVHRVLEPSGVLWIATDVAARFEWMLETLATTPLAVERLPGRTNDLPETNFETKYRREGRPLFYARAIKPRVA